MKNDGDQEKGRQPSRCEWMPLETTPGAPEAWQRFLEIYPPREEIVTAYGDAIPFWEDTWVQQQAILGIAQQAAIMRGNGEQLVHDVPWSIVYQPFEFLGEIKHSPEWPCVVFRLSGVERAFQVIWTDSITYVGVLPVSMTERIHSLAHAEFFLREVVAADKARGASGPQ